MRLGCLEDTVVPLYLLFFSSCLHPRLVDLSRSLFCAESVPIPMKRQSLVNSGANTTYNKQVRGFCCTVVHPYLRTRQVLRIRPLYVYEPPAPRGTGNRLNRYYWSARLHYGKHADLSKGRVIFCVLALSVASPFSVPTLLLSGGRPVLIEWC